MSNQSKLINNGLVNLTCSHEVKAMTDRLEALLVEKGFTVFSRIDHAAGAKKIGKYLRPTELLIFGNPNSGTPLMQNIQTCAIDLPQKFLIWEDATGKVWISYNDPNYLIQRHSLTSCDELIKKIENSLKNIIEEALK